MSETWDLVIGVDRMNDGTWDVRLTIGGITLRRTSDTELDAMMIAQEIEGFLEMRGVEFDGEITAPPND